jgi:rod shape-determining protein MreC
MSIAILWTHPDFRVSAMAADGSAFGIVGAHLGSGPERYLLEMRGVPIRSTLKPGTQIVSSGLGGVFPRGIPLGTILGEIKTTEGWAHTYLLRPTVVPAALGAVMVLLPPRAAAKVDNVWANGVGTEEATRTAVAAGDSLTRAAAQAQAAVQAARDSALRVMASRDSLKQLVVDSTARVRRDTATTRRLIVGYDSTGAPVYRTVRRDTAAMRRRRDSVGVAPPPNVFQIPARPPRRDSARGRPDSTRRP